MPRLAMTALSVTVASAWPAQASPKPHQDRPAEAKPAPARAVEAKPAEAAPAAAGTGEVRSPAAPGELLEVPTGTLVSVELVDPLHSGRNKTGDAFRARVVEGIYVRGRLAVPPNTTVRGVLAEAVASGRLKGRSKLDIALRALELDGRSYEIHTDTLSYAGDPHAGKNFGSLLGGALQGALFGVLFGGEKGAVIGAGAGAAAGGVSTIMKGKQDVDFPQGAKLLFETVRPVTVPVFPAAAPAPAPLPGAGPAEEKPAPAKDKPEGVKPAS